MCPIEQCKGTIGNCRLCSSKSDCILMTILEKLESLDERFEVRE